MSLNAKLLIVDDEPSICHLLDVLLTGEGYEVTTAANGEEAMMLASRQQYDLVMIDLMMPVKDGIETILELRASQPWTRIVAMSGGWADGTRSYLPLAGKLGACRTLAKPFDRSSLLDAVSSEVDHRQFLSA